MVTSNSSRYVLITPARDEADYIEITLRAVTQQTVPPTRWIIVSDGSTDGTDDIVRRYANQYPYLELVRREPNNTRNFASRIFAFREGEARLNGLDYEYIGNLDADISFEPEYYETVLACLEADPDIGIGAGRLYELIDGNLKERATDPNYGIPNGIQLFRRECYEQIGGYMALRFGGPDAVAEAGARMRGWKTRTFMDIPAVHHRVTGSAISGGSLRAAYRRGMQEFVNGYHPVFELAKSLKLMTSRPYVLGASARLSGYLTAWIRRFPREVPNDIKTYIQKEQMQRLRGVIPTPGRESSAK